MKGERVEISRNSKKTVCSLTSAIARVVGHQSSIGIRDLIRLKFKIEQRIHNLACQWYKKLECITARQGKKNCLLAVPKLEQLYVNPQSLVP